MHKLTDRALHFVYPGTFSPPTLGHFAIVKRAAAICPHLTIVCSTNADKHGQWFSEGEAVELWKRYPLPENVSVRKFDDVAKGEYIMVRGIRDAQDYDDERRVMEFNHEKFGIAMFTHIISDAEHKDISSSRVRESASRADLESLSRMLHPALTSYVLERALGLHNIFLVVGRPGSGKSTLLDRVCAIDKRNVRINTDEFSDHFKALLRTTFGVEDLVELMRTREEEATKLIGKQWLAMLGECILACPSDTNIFVEAAYGLPKRLYRFVGGKIIIVHCDEDDNRARIMSRGTPEHLPFVEKIPPLEESLNIVRSEGLSCITVNTNRLLAEIDETCYSLNKIVSTVRGKEVFSCAL